MFTKVVIFTILFGCALSRNIREETTCQTHAQNAGGSGALQWDIKCDNDGHYLPLQCTVQTPKWCSCYNQTDRVSQASNKIKSCECLLAKNVAVISGKSTCEIPVCNSSGTFEKKQCCPTTQKCRCVDPKTGRTTVQEISNMNLQCP
ncbi:uncharacterized protein CDAR_38991 [Caerostris darwini]|uniref:Thyroglobulin type-1 domain-containing protein n=1 Tax=Caerostris darwini TaxID=1538125 RepID=A0AAV4UQS2_9ARAC|nr:uncharacterized protein CDAR_38991 [Caerostris darwini]